MTEPMQFTAEELNEVIPGDILLQLAVIARQTNVAVTISFAPLGALDENTER